jgi:hypothetical protein
MGPLATGDLGNTDRWKKESRGGEKRNHGQRGAASPRNCRTATADFCVQSEPSVAGW